MSSVEISAAGKNKGIALDTILLILGFDLFRVIACGDNHNDISMLRCAGESVAMGNAILRLKFIAQAQAKSNAEDGVAQYLEHTFLNTNFLNE